MKVRTSELTGAALDWAVAKCEDTLGHYVQPNGKRGTTKWEVLPQTRRYSTNWAQGGPIIEREMREHGFDVWRTEDMGECAASYTRGVPAEYVFGPTPLIAAMRCFVASKLGDEVDVPEEFLK